MTKNLISRLIVAAIAIPIILWICYQGGGWLFGLLLVSLVVGAIEFLTNEKFGWDNPFLWITTLVIAYIYFLLSGYNIAILKSLTADFELSNIDLSLIVLVIFFLLSAMIHAIGKQTPKQLFSSHSRLFWGVTYLSFTYPTVFLIGQGIGDYNGGDSLMFLFGLLWVGDTAAMGIGSWIGKHKLAPSVSPNKTIEGFIGGIVGAIAIGILMYFWKFSNMDFIQIIALSIGCSVFGQVGDLVESMWKRSIGIKDSSAIIPGHGGVLDRFDSLLFAAPFMYFYLNLL
ncbi:MAG: phosphatidate cytidylyltransferase [bacterium]